jgi:hypothetical protein
MLVVVVKLVENQVRVFKYGLTYEVGISVEYIE